MSMIQSHFEINLSYQGEHYFRVDLPPQLTREIAIERAAEMQMHYPRVRGFLVSLSWISCGGHAVEWEKPEPLTEQDLVAIHKQRG